MAQTKTNRRSTRMLTVGLILFTLSVIAISIVVTLGIRGAIDLSVFGIGEGARGSSYQNITLTDAQLECEQEAKDEYGERLRLFTVDNHSSRFDQKANRYKMFFKMDVYTSKKGPRQPREQFYVNCFVHGAKGSVTHFETLEDKEEAVKPQRKPESSVFGF